MPPMPIPPNPWFDPATDTRTDIEDDGESGKSVVGAVVLDVVDECKCIDAGSAPACEECEDTGGERTSRVGLAIRGNEEAPADPCESILNRGAGCIVPKEPDLCCMGEVRN